MSSSKNSKADFIAIYRLEFYKNKRNWQLGSKGNKIETKIQNVLNTTYDVEDGSGSQLNDAFIDTGSDIDRTTKSKPDSPTKPNLSQQWLESINIWPAGVDKPESNDILQKLLSRNNPEIVQGNVKERENVCVNCPGLEREINEKVLELKMEYLPKRDEIRPRSINTATCKSALTKEEATALAELQAQYFALDPGTGGTVWPVYNPAVPPPLIVPEVDRPAPDWPQGWPTQNPGQEDVDAVDGADHNYLSAGFLDLQREFNLVEEQMSCRSVDSFSEFSRGADLAPHASELELTEPLKGEELDANQVACMSSLQLSAAVQAHAHRLAQLLWESGERRKLRNSHSFHERMSVEEFPTHDTGPYRAHDNDFIAGSFRPPPQRGRGRVVIEGGRPVRLHGDFV